MPETFDRDEFDKMLREVDATRSASKNTDAPGEPRDTPSEAVDRRTTPPPRTRRVVVLRRVLIGVLILAGLMGYTASRGVSGWAALAGGVLGAAGVMALVSGVMFAGYAKKRTFANVVEYSDRRVITGLAARVVGLAFLGTPLLVALMPPDGPREGSRSLRSEGAAIAAFFCALVLYATVIAFFRKRPGA